MVAGPAHVNTRVTDVTHSSVGTRAGGGVCQGMRCITRALAAALVATATADAQAPAVRGVSLWPGTELRATLAPGAAPAGRGVRAVRGRLVSLTSDSLKVTPRGTGTIATYRLVDVERLEVRGRRQRKLGFALGALAGAGIGAAVATSDWRRGGISRDQYAGVLAASAIGGGWIGFAFAPREWVALPLR